MKTGNLFLSFWNICLENLPVGAFRQRRITPDAARRRIEKAREADRLLCVSDDDLLAPYHKAALDNHTALCRALNDQFGIVLQIKDFFHNCAEEGDSLYSVAPLNCVQVKGPDRLLVITCAYAFDEKCKPGERPKFKVEPSSIAFHLFEHMPKLTAKRPIGMADGAISDAREKEPRSTLAEVEEELRALSKLKREKTL